MKGNMEGFTIHSAVAVRSRRMGWFTCICRLGGEVFYRVDRLFSGGGGGDDDDNDGIDYGNDDQNDDAITGDHSK